MNFTGTINSGMSKLSRSMKNGVDNCKLNGKIADEQKKIKMLTREIGSLAIVRLEAGDEMCPEIMERYTAIKEAKEKIAEIEKGRKRSTIVCQDCGAKTSINMNFCGSCGAELKKEI